MESLKIEVRETQNYQYLMGLIALQRGDPATAVALLKKACTEDSIYAERWLLGRSEEFRGQFGPRTIGESASFAGHIKKVRSVSFVPGTTRVFSVGEDAPFACGIRIAGAA